MIISAVLIYLAKIIGGWMLAHLIWDARDAKALLFKFFLGLGIGSGISSLLYFLWFWSKIPLVLYPWIELALFIGLLTAVFMREKNQKTKKTAASFTFPTWQNLLWAGLVTLAVFFCTSAFLIRALQTPHGVQDAWGIWNVSARFIYGAGERWLQIIPQNAWFHPDYPLLVSLNIAEVWSIIGTNITRVPIVFALIYMLGLIGLLASALAIARDNQQGAFAAILFASVPVVAFLASNQYADVPLAYFFLGTAALFYIYSISAEKRLLIFAGLFAGLAGWTKNEGLAFIGIAILLCLILSLNEKKNLLKHFFAGLALPLLALLLFKSITPPNDLFTQLSTSLQQFLDPSRYLTIILKMLTMSVSFGGWPVSFALMFGLYTLLGFSKQTIKGKLWLPLVLLVGQFISYFGIYLFTPADVTVHMNTSLERLFFHLFPLTIFLILNVVRSPHAFFKSSALTND